MATAVGALKVMVQAGTAEFQSDMGRIVAISRTAGNDIKTAMSTAASSLSGSLKKQIDDLGLSFEGITSKVGKVGLAMAGVSAGVGIATLIGKFSGAIEAAAHLQDLSEKTGASVESLSRISQVSKIAGQDVDSLSIGMVKLAKGMEASGGPSKATSDALSRIGLSVKDLKGLDTGEMVEKIASKFAQFADGAGKTAIAVELFGKRGAEMVKTLNMMGESEGLAVKTTEAQAQAADAYEKNLVRLTITKDALYKTIALEAVPAANNFVKALIEMNNATDGVRAGAKELASDGTLKSWAENGALALGYLIDGVQVLYRSFEALGMMLGAGAAQAAAIIRGEFSSVSEIGKAYQADVSKLANTPLFTTRMAEAANSAAGETGKRATISGGNTGAIANAAGDNFIKGLKERIAKAGEGEIAMLRLQAAEKGVTAQAEPLIEKLITQQGLKSADQYAKNLELSTQSLEFQTSLVGKTAQEQEILNLQHSKEVEFQKIKIDLIKQYGEMAPEAESKMSAAMEEATTKQIALIKARQEAERTFSFGANKTFRQFSDDASNYGKLAENMLTNSVNNMSDALANFATTGKLSFTNLANGIISDIIRIQARAAMAGLGSSLSGLFGGNVSGTPYTSASPSGAGKYNVGGAEMTITAVQANGGAWINGVQAFANGGVVSRPTMFPMASGAGLMGEAGPEGILPLARAANGKLGVQSVGGGGKGGDVVINVINNSSQAQATATSKTDAMGNRQIEIMVADMVNKAISTGRTDAAMRNAYNIRRSGK